MTRVSEYVIGFAAAAFLGQAAAQDQDCDLAERYYALAQDSRADFDDNGAAGWLRQAAELCPRFIYLYEFGEIRAQSLDIAERAEAVDAFINAHAIAESDGERAAALSQYAGVLSREGEAPRAYELILQAQQLNPSDAQIERLAATIQAQIENPNQGSTVRAVGTTFYKPLNVESDGLRAYPWPPEPPSSRAFIDRERSSWLRDGMSLAEVHEMLSRSLRNAAYSDWSLYSAPGGFVMVTRFEAIGSDGTPLDDIARYRLPDDDRDFGFFAFVRSLFDAPEGYYRFIAFVVSDKPYTASRATLEESVALRRLRRGSNRLPDEYDDMEFTEDHAIEALIYEFRMSEDANNIETLSPGLISGEIHLQRSGLSTALFN